ncbi:phosphatase PAP2 family protein [Pacificimonas flava]|nr:phosphatase PAP2 family protein [Pacificimonas flava]MBB5280618.1 hypothetical protein [Pacificimonas flava]
MPMHAVRFERRTPQEAAQFGISGADARHSHWRARWQRYAGPELTFVALLTLIGVALAITHGVSIALPGAATLAIFGIHYLVPVATMGIWAGVLFVQRRSGEILYYALVFAAYLLLLVLHFNLKLWIPVLNPAAWDDVYWQTDRAMQPVIALAYAGHNWLQSAFGNIDSWYLFGFVLMFYFSYILHAVQSPLVFRRLVLSSFLVQGLGGLAYLVAPAVGPFIYQEGANALATETQADMLAAHQAIRHQGASWLNLNAEHILTGGLAAMPSLHTAASAVFLYFAWRYLPGLVVLYLPAFGFILMEAVATRWHYIVDLPAGAALAAFSIWAAHCLYPDEDSRRRAEVLKV